MPKRRIIPKKTKKIKEEKKMIKKEVLKELIDYQEKSIVSREIIKKKTGNITVFAFDENQELSTHISVFDALIHVLEGKTEIIVNKEKFELKEGEIILMPANKPHSVKAKTKFKMLLTLIKE